MEYFKDPSSENCEGSIVGGKARNLWLLERHLNSPVPPWFALTTSAFTNYIDANGISGTDVVITPANIKQICANIQTGIMDGYWPTGLRDELVDKLSKLPFSESYLAIRSSGTDEDSSSHSFAGQFESYLYQKGVDQVLSSIKRCWSSCYSERVMSHRLECGMKTVDIKMAVIVQVMVNSQSSGVAFSRHPLKPLSSNAVFIEAVFGLGEGLVSGELEADQYEVSREELSVSCQVADKNEQMIRNAESGGLIKVSVKSERVKERALTDEQAQTIAKLMIELEKKTGKPQDFEWGIENGQLYCLQARPIVTLPPSCFFDNSATGTDVILWDNSNIVESYSGVTSPLTFSFASTAGVPSGTVKSLKPYLSNLLGLVRGNIYYNLLSWYRCLACLPLGDTSKYMETMMGVKQTLDHDLESEIGSIQRSAPRYSLWVKMKLLLAVVTRVYFIDSYVEQFTKMFNKHYEEALSTDFNSLTLQEQVKYMKHLHKEVLGNWNVPIYNDTYVMLFFGLLKSLVSKYLTNDTNRAQSLQNDLLCGQGDVESTEPTKMMMRIAQHIDTVSPQEIKDWFLNNKEEVLMMLEEEKAKASGLLQSDHRSFETKNLQSEGLRQRKKNQSKTSSADTQSSFDPLQQEKWSIIQSIQRFLNKYGFRCINELKLEENTLHDDPGFVTDSICGYINTKAYNITDMEEREQSIRKQAEDVVSQTLSFPRKLLFNWVLFHARRGTAMPTMFNVKIGVRHRENLRFARTKLFGVFRNLFRAIGANFVKLELLKDHQDVFYLTMEEIHQFVEGRCVTNNLSGLVELRKKEFDSYRQGLSPPERFLTRGACGIHFLFPQVLDDLDLLKDQEVEAASDPNTLKGTPCCPGIVTGTVRVARTIKETEGLNGEILVTSRTDPGWVPLYPLCAGLVIERGSLLSHSAVVARELGLPTIVGVSGGLMKRLRTGMSIKMDAGKGIVVILNGD